MATNSAGGAFLPGADYAPTGAWDFTTAPTVASVSLVSATSTQTLTNKTLTSPTINTPTIATPAITGMVVTGDANTGVTIGKLFTFTENATSTTHTATCVIPAGATLLDIFVWNSVLWTGGTATFTCGDANSANGWFTSTNMKATDLLVGERLQASNPNNWGGVNGAYLTTAGRFGQQSGNMIGGYCATAYSVIGVITVGTPATTAGRSFMLVTYNVGQVTAATSN